MPRIHVYLSPGDTYSWIVVPNYVFNSVPGPELDIEITKAKLFPQGIQSLAGKIRNISNTMGMGTRKYCQRLVTTALTFCE